MDKERWQDIDIVGAWEFSGVITHVGGSFSETGYHFCDMEGNSENIPDNSRQDSK